MKNKIYSTMFIAAIALIVAACGKPDPKAQLEKLRAEQASLAKQIAELEKTVTPDSIKVKLKEIAVAEVKPQKFDHFVQTQGMIEAVDNIMVSAKSAGVLTQVFVREGDAVVKGQTLAQIDNSLVLRGIEELKSGLELAKTVFDRQKNLWDQKIGTEIQYLQAKNNKESTERRLATLNEQLEMSKMKSPITGTIDAVNIKIGENVAPGVPAFRVINTNDLKIASKISEAYVNNIKKGDRVLISLSDSDRKFDAKVTFVGRNIDQLTRSFPIEVKVPSATDLRPNMTAVIQVIFHSEPAALCVPINLVQDVNGQKVVYVAEMDGGKLVARKRVVEVVGVYNNLAQLKTGIKAGDKVITVGYQGLNDGELVKI
jgi:membrane fusion protein, multidrug efflux system